MNEFQPIEELRIGKIIEVNGTALKIEIDSGIVDLLKIYNGKVYPIGQMSSVLKILFGRKILFAYVNLLKMKNEFEEEAGRIKFSDNARIIECNLFGEGQWIQRENILKFSSGIETYPLPQQIAYLMTQQELDFMYQGAERRKNNDIYPYVTIGKYSGSNQECSLNIDKMFCQHCAVLGSTGSGKSGTVAAILHSVLDYQYDSKSLLPNIVLIDPHGEYDKAFVGKSKIYRAYSSQIDPGEEITELKLPYWLMTSGEFRELVVGKTEFEATSQNNIVYEALGYSKMVYAGILGRYEENATGRQKYELMEGKSESDVEKFDRDKPLPFLLSDFIFHINVIQGRKAGKTDDLSTSDRKDIDGILRKLSTLRSNPQLRFLLEEYNNRISLKDVLEQFITVKDKIELKIIDISGIPNEVAGILTAMISRLLFQFKVWEKREEREKNPILLVCEEAHRYVPNTGEAQYKEAQNAVRRIAKEGRKYGLGLLLISQRPSDVESTVLSQCNTWVVLKLTNSNDKSYIGNFMPDNNSGLIKNLSSLSRREAIIVGEAVAMPSRVKIKELREEQLPDSKDISFVKGWQKNETDQDYIINSVIAKWTSL